MRVLYSVMVDLAGFLRSELQLLFGKRQENRPLSYSISADTPAVVESIDTSESQARIVGNRDAQPVTRTQIHSGQDVFVLYPDTPCYLRPALVRDTVLGRLPYAAPVRAVATQADWVRVVNDELEGWTERTHLTTERADVVPGFVAGQVYDADHPETLKLRTYIADEFSAAALHVPALNCEYVWFAMLQNQTEFSWPPLRPRTPGRWSEILRPESTVHVSAVPMTGSIMEYNDTTRTAQLWYVEAVAPDESVTFSGFAGDDTGLFTIKTMSKDEWTSYQPRYIIKK